jgi:hypothetical protein
MGQGELLIARRLPQSQHPWLAKAFAPTESQGTI